MASSYAHVKPVGQVSRVEIVVSLALITTHVLLGLFVSQTPMASVVTVNLAGLEFIVIKVSMSFISVLFLLPDI